MSKVYGYVILNKETREQWGGVYGSKSGAVNAYNSHHYRYAWPADRHKFKDQDKYGMYPVVVADEVDHADVLFKLVEHGGEGHRGWLRDALRAYFDNKEQPVYVA